MGESFPVRLARLACPGRVPLSLAVAVGVLCAVGCTFETRNKISRNIQNWTGTNGVVDVFSDGKVLYRFIDVEKLTTADASGGEGESRAYRFGYGVLDLNLNYKADAGEVKTYFEVSNYSTPYVFYEKPTQSK